MLVGLLRGLLLVDEQPRAVRELHAKRNGDPQDLRLAFRLEQLDDGDRHSVFQTAVFGDDADLLVARVLSLAADFHPWRVHQLRLRRRPAAVPAAPAAQAAPVGPAALLAPLLDAALAACWLLLCRGSFASSVAAKVIDQWWRSTPGPTAGPIRSDDPLQLFPCFSVRGECAPERAAGCPALSGSNTAGA